jgi:beta-glucosidase
MLTRFGIGLTLAQAPRSANALRDERRVWYIDAVLAGLRGSIAKGVPVMGYLHWSLLDNFEWGEGLQA